MTLAPLPELLAAAGRDGYALGYFEAWDSYSLDAVVEAAEAERAPVILGFGCLIVDQDWLDRGGIETYGALGRVAADRAEVPTALLLNEAHTVDQARRGLDAGFNAVMVHDARAEEVAALVQEAHARGAAVEGELGELPDGVDGGGSLTDPAEAAAYVAESGVDCLAVSFGNVHVLEGRASAVDLDRLEKISRAVDVPLAVHGGSSFPAELVPRAIERGAAKFNVGTTLKRAFLDGLREAFGGEADLHALVGSRGSADMVGAGAERMRDVVRELIRLYGGSGRA